MLKLNERFNVRRLGLTDIARLRKVVDNILVGAAYKGVTFEGKEGGLTELAGFLFAGLDFADDDLVSWLRSLVIDLPADEDLYLPDLMDLITFLPEHPDVTGFLESGKKGFGRLSVMLEKLLPNLETEDPTLKD